MIFIIPPLFYFIQPVVISDTTGRLRQTSHFTGSFAGSGREQLINSFQWETSGLREDTNHRGNSVLLIVLLQSINYLDMLIGHFGDTFNAFYIINPVLVEIITFEQESIFINLETFTIVN